MNTTLVRKHAAVWRLGAGKAQRHKLLLLYAPVLAIFVATLVIAATIDEIYYKYQLDVARAEARHDAAGAAIAISKLPVTWSSTITQKEVGGAAFQPLNEDVKRLAEAFEDRVSVIADSGVVLADSDLKVEKLRAVQNHKDRPEIMEARARGNGHDRRFSETLGIEYIYAAERLEYGTTEYYVRVALPLKKLNAHRDFMRIVLYSGALICIAIVAAMSWIFGSQLSQTVKRSHEEKLKLSMDERVAVLATMQELGSMLAICDTVSEAAEVIEAQIPALIPGRSGALALMRNSRNLLVVEHEWGDDWRKGDMIKPNQCWALRKNEVHFSHNGDLDCAHGRIFDDEVRMMCIPLVAQGEILGIIHIREEARQPFTEENIEIAKTIGREIATALSNIKLRATLREQAQHDPLTGLHNRRFLEEQFDALTTQATYESKRCGLLIIDVDHFKSYNDKYGHDAGDYVLAQLAKLFKKSVKDSDIACRLGGEEFGIMLFDADAEQAIEFANDLRMEVEKMSLVYEGRPLGDITISVGLSCFPDDGIKLYNLLKSADEFLYEAKNAGRNQVCYEKAA